MRKTIFAVGTPEPFCSFAVWEEKKIFDFDFPMSCDAVNVPMNFLFSFKMS